MERIRKTYSKRNYTPFKIGDKVSFKSEFIRGIFTVCKYIDDRVGLNNGDKYVGLHLATDLKKYER